MGEGLYRVEGGHTVYVEPFDGLGEGGDEGRAQAWESLIEDLAGCVTRHWGRPERERCRDGAVVVLVSGIYELTLHEDAYARVHVTVLVREGLDEDIERTARAMLHGVAGLVFRRLAELYPLRRRTSAWTSAPYNPGAQEVPMP